MYIRQKEHNPPHIHAIYGEYIGMFSLVDGKMFEGDIPIKVQQMVTEFVMFYKERLVKMWQTQEFEILPPIR